MMRKCWYFLVGGLASFIGVYAQTPFLDSVKQVGDQMAGGVTKAVHETGQWTDKAAQDIGHLATKVEQDAEKWGSRADAWVVGAAHDTGAALRKPAVKLWQTGVATINIAADIKNAVSTIESAIKPIKSSIAQFPTDFPKIGIDMKKLSGNADVMFTKAAHNVGVAFKQNVEMMLNKLTAAKETYITNSQAGIGKINNKDMSGIRDIVDNAIKGASKIHEASVQGVQEFAQSMALANKLVSDSLTETMQGFYEASWREPFIHTFDISDQLITVVRSLTKLLDTINGSLIETVLEEHAAHADVDRVSKDIKSVIDDIQKITSGLREAIKK